MSRDIDNKDRLRCARYQQDDNNLLQTIENRKLGLGWQNVGGLCWLMGTFILFILFNTLKFSIYFALLFCPE